MKVRHQKASLALRILIPWRYRTRVSFPLSWMVDTLELTLTGLPGAGEVNLSQTLDAGETLLDAAQSLVADIATLTGQLRVNTWFVWRDCDGDHRTPLLSQTLGRRDQDAAEGLLEDLAIQITAPSGFSLVDLVDLVAAELSSISSDSKHCVHYKRYCNGRACVDGGDPVGCW